MNAITQTIHDEINRIFLRPYLSDIIPKNTLPNNQPVNIMDMVTQERDDLSQTRSHWKREETHGYITGEAVRVHF